MQTIKLWKASGYLVPREGLTIIIEGEPTDDEYVSGDAYRMRQEQAIAMANELWQHCATITLSALVEELNRLHSTQVEALAEWEAPAESEQEDLIAE